MSKKSAWQKLFHIKFLLSAPDHSGVFTLVAEGGQTPPASSHAGPPAANNGWQHQDTFTELGK